MVEHHSSEGEMSDEVCEQNLWSADQLHPLAGGCKFEPHMAGTGYVR